MVECVPTFAGVVLRVEHDALRCQIARAPGFLAGSLIQPGRWVAFEPPVGPCRYRTKVVAADETWMDVEYTVSVAAGDRIIVVGGVAEGT